MTYFKSRTPREQILIVIMVVLVLIFAVWQFIIHPVLNAKADALQAQSVAQRDLSIVQNGLPKLLVTQNKDNRKAAPFNRRAIIDVARQTNIAISRVQPEGDEAMKVWFEDTPSQTLYTFLTHVTRDYSVEISRVNINRRDGGVVAAQITLVPLT